MKRILIQLGNVAIIWHFEVQEIKYKRLLFVYICAEPIKFQPNCADVAIANKHLDYTVDKTCR